MKRRTLTLLLAGSLLLTGCGTIPEKPAVTSDTLHVEKVENLPGDFIFGMDASCVPALQKSGVRYYDHNGAEKDVFEILLTRTATATAAATATWKMPLPSARPQQNAA